MAGFFDDIEANDVKAAAAQEKKQKPPVREKEAPKSNTEKENKEPMPTPILKKIEPESDTSSEIDIEDEDKLETPVSEAVSVFDTSSPEDGFEKPHTGTDISGEFTNGSSDDDDPEIFTSPSSTKVEEKVEIKEENNAVKEAPIKEAQPSVQIISRPVSSAPNSSMTILSSKINGYVRTNGAATVSCEITDGIDASGDITIDTQGSVSGKVDAGENKVSVAGHVNGQIIAGNVEISGKVRSGLKAKTISVSQSAIVIGDIDGTETVIAGAVKGNISGDTVKLMPTAIIQGNVTAKSITMEDGSSISGVCRQTGSKVNPDDYFAKLGV